LYVNAVKHALGYLSAHPKIALHLYKENPEKMNIIVYMDANWAGATLCLLAKIWFPGDQRNKKWLHF
jgi:hypothetical protein